MTASTASTETTLPAAAGSPSASGVQLRAILARIRAAARAQGTPTHAGRVASLDRLQRALLGRKDAIAAAISRDFGNRSAHETLLSELFTLVSSIKYTRAHLADWMRADERETSWVFLPARSEVVYQPVGVVGIIAPWNYPLQLALAPLVAALAAGNRAMIKPSELVPETAELLRDLVSDTFPEDQVAVVTGGIEVGEAFASLPFDHLVFTGSTRVGRRVMQAASENLVPVTLELGGKSPAIVGLDADVRVAADRIMAGDTFNAGQTCIAPDYALVPADRRDAFVEACKASVARMFPTLAHNADYTSIINDRHYARVRGYIDDARSRGAGIVELNPAGETLEASGRKIAPTLVLDPTDEMLCMQEEIFGPVLPVVTYRRLDDAINYVNDRPRPLALYYFGHKRADVERVLDETVSGGVAINETLMHFVQEDLPFGGVGPSGMGHYHAREGFLTLSKPKAVFYQARLNTTGLLRPPYGKLADRLLRVLVGGGGR
jgi:coniferyl-aldehyde dehydrogenase